MEANTWRGEVTLTIAEEKHILRPTFAALNEIERKLDTGILTLALMLVESELNDTALRVMIAATIQTKDFDVSLLEDHRDEALLAIAQMLIIALEGIGHA